ncbi:unnamed protein product [Arabis nemorensis]|uniref:Uncharacterized protein n=1 Tax=Arabis nemorensis TaxID=586526 RepID=A0A565AYC1_9BRAS|nr:unnamed protein product [Arabis nemorensis]
MNKRATDEEEDGVSDIDSGDMLDTQENEEMYCVSVDDNTHLSNEYTNEPVVDVELVHKYLGEHHESLLVVSEVVVEYNLLRQPYKTQSLAIESSNDKVRNNIAYVVLTKMITMNSKRRRQYSLHWSFQAY